MACSISGSCAFDPDGPTVNIEAGVDDGSAVLQRRLSGCASDMAKRSTAGHPPASGIVVSARYALAPGLANIAPRLNVTQTTAVEALRQVFKVSSRLRARRLPRAREKYPEPYRVFHWLQTSPRRDRTSQTSRYPALLVHRHRINCGAREMFLGSSSLLNNRRSPWVRGKALRPRPA